jgi:hypothetical protein
MTQYSLVISKQLCEIRDVKMWDKKELGRGSTFYFIIVAPVNASAGVRLPRVLTTAGF